MAVKTYMRPTLAIVARTIAEFAIERGLERSEFALAGAWQETTGHIGLSLGTTRNVEWFEWYKTIIERLQAEFEAAGAPDAAWNVGLVVHSPRTQDELYSRFRLAEGDEDVTDFLESKIDAVWAERKPSAAGHAN